MADPGLPPHWQAAGSPAPASVARALPWGVALGVVVATWGGPLLEPTRIPGHAGGVYPRLNALVGTFVLGFPEPAPPPPLGALDRVIGLGASVVGAPNAWKVAIVLALAASALALRGAAAPLRDRWAAPALVAVGLVGPAATSAAANGDLPHVWAAALPLALPASALPLGLVAVALFAPAWLSAFGACAVAAALRRARTDRIVALCAICALGGAFAASGGVGPASPGALFVASSWGPTTSRLAALPLGVSTVAVLAGAAAVAPDARVPVAVAVGALAASFLSFPGTDALLAVGVLAALALVRAASSLGRRLAPAAIVLSASWMIIDSRSGAPLPDATLEIPGALSPPALGPVLDLPTSPPYASRALWLQSAHGGAIAADARGEVRPAIARAVRQMLDGGCPDFRAMGFSRVALRREGEWRAAERAFECLGDPDEDDGFAARWELR